MIEQQKDIVEDKNSEEDEQIRYFKEEEFREHMQEQDQKYADLKQRWEMQELSRYEWNDGDVWRLHDDNVSVAISEATKNRKPSVQVTVQDEEYEIDLNLMQQQHIETGVIYEVRTSAGGHHFNDAIPVFSLKSLNAADKLSGVQAPDELLKYYQAEHKMLRYFNVLKSEDDNMDHRKTGGDRALGLCIWFRRWLRIHRGRRHAVSNTGGTRSQSREPDGGRRGSLAGQRVRSAGQIRRHVVP